MTLDLVPFRGHTVPVLNGKSEISRYSMQQYLNDRTFSFNGMTYHPGNSYGIVTTYNNKPAEPISYNFAGFVEGMLYADGPVAAAEGYRLRVFGQAPLLYQELVDGRPGDLFDDDALERLREPWPSGNLGDLMKRALIYGDFAGNAFVLDIDDELVLVRPDWVEILLAKREFRGGQVGWRQMGIVYYEGGLHVGDGVPFLPGEYCHFVPGLPDPLAAYRGMSWLTPLIREVQSDKSAMDHKVAFFSNAATPNLAVSLPKEITPEQFRKFVDEMDEKHKGPLQAGKTLYTAGGADVTVIGANMKEMDFSSVMGKSETRIANAAGVPPVLLSFSEGMQGSSLNAGNYTAAKRNFVDTTMRDLWQNWAGSLQKMDAFRPPKAKARLWYDGRDIPFLHEDAKDRAEIQQIEASTLSSHISAGWKPESAVLALMKDDLKVLEHTGLTSVQLVPPGTSDEDGDGVDDAESEYDVLLDEFRAELGDWDIDRARWNLRHDAGTVGGGQFRKLSDAIVALLRDWDGVGDPFRDDDGEIFTQPQLKKAATQLGIDVPPRSSAPKIKASILKKLRGDAPDARPAKKAAPRRVRPQDIKLGTTLRDPETGEEAKVVAEGLHTVDIEWTANGETHRKTVRKQDIADFNDRPAPAKKATPRAPAKLDEPPTDMLPGEGPIDYKRRKKVEALTVGLDTVTSQAEALEHLKGHKDSDLRLLAREFGVDVRIPVAGDRKSRTQTPSTTRAATHDELAELVLQAFVFNGYRKRWEENAAKKATPRAPAKKAAPKASPGPFDVTIGGLAASVDTSPSDDPDPNRIQGQIHDGAGKIVGDFRYVLDPAGHTVHLDEIALAPEHQRKGFATAFDQHVGREVAKQGYTRMTVSAAYRGGVTWARLGYGWDSTKVAPFGDVPIRMITRLMNTDDASEQAQLRDWLDRFGGDRKNWPTPQEIAAAPYGRAILDGSAWQGERSLADAPDPDPESAARQRQADIDAARKYSAVAGELSEFLDAEADPEVTARRLRQEGRKQGIADEVEPIAAAVEGAAAPPQEGSTKLPDHIRDALEAAEGRHTARMLPLTMVYSGVARESYERHFTAEQRQKILARLREILPGMTEDAPDRPGVERVIGDLEAIEVEMADPAAAAIKLRAEADALEQRIKAPYPKGMNPYQARNYRDDQYDRRNLLDKLRKRIDRLDALSAAPTGDNAEATRLMSALLERHGITPDNAAGDTARFTPGAHTAIGAPIRQGAPVRVVRPGFTLERDGERIRVAKAVVEEVDAPAARLSDAEVDDRVRVAWQGRPKAPGGWVGLADLRADLSDLSREDVDAALRRIARMPGVRVAPLDNQRALDQADRDAAIRIGDSDRHMLAFDRVGTPGPPDPLSDLRTLDPEAARDALDLRTVAQLKPLLKSAGLPVSGRKRDLVDRLVGHLHPGDSPTEVREPVGRQRAGTARDISRNHETMAAVYNASVDENGSWIESPRGDPALIGIAREQGFDAQPAVMTSAEFDRAVAEGGHAVMYRGVDPDSFWGEGKWQRASGAEVHAQLREGDYHPGYGVFGNGYYFATDREKAESFSDGEPGSLGRYALASDARVVDYEDLHREYGEYFDSDYQGDPLETQGVTSDFGRFAASRGYDAIRVPVGTRMMGGGRVQREEWVVLNRGALIADRGQS